MAVAIKIPTVGESITQGVLTQWLQQDGALVHQDDPLFELETEKATTTVSASVTGKLHIATAAGTTVTIGAEVGSIEPMDVPAPPLADGKNASVKAPAAASAALPLAPAVRRIVEEQKVPVEAVPASGRGGRVTKEDVVNYLEKQPPAPTPAGDQREPAGAPPAKPTTETRTRLSAIRQRIAERLLQSQQTTATLTTFNEVDLSSVLALRARYKEPFKEKHHVGLGFMAFFVKAAVAALKAYPLVHSRIEGQDVVTPAHHHIGVAVSTEKGLMVPVVRDADSLSFAEIERRIAELAGKARDGKISIDDLQGGSFTITNGGVFGSLLSTPILNPPQSAILGMHTIQKRPVVVDDQIVIRPMMYVALSYDHRLIDGREAVLFLVRIKECVENPERLLLEV